MNRTLTVIIHGTWAREEKWWQLGSKNARTFADSLAERLDTLADGLDSDLKGSVWKPALAKGFSYENFTWSGENWHRDRIEGARKLSSNLNRLAQHYASSPRDPLIVNFVAHSHGGNVVLEALRGLRPNVRTGRIVLLGTPLVTVKPALRIGRFASTTLLLALFLSAILIILYLAAYHSVALTLLGDYGLPDTSLLLFPLIIPVYGWLLWLLGNTLNVAWRVMCRPFRPLAWLWGKSSSLAYGPSPRRLRGILRGQPILLLDAQNDESDVLLWTTSNLAQNYKRYLIGNLSAGKLLLEYIFLRPLVYGTLLRTAEMFLERLVIGFPLRRVLWFDYAVLPPKEQSFYPSDLLACRDVNIPPDTVDKIAAEAGRREQLPGITAEGAGVQEPGLLPMLREVTQFIQKQIKLRHGLYYVNEDVIEQTASFLAKGHIRTAKETGPYPSLQPSDDFWEALLVMNVALGALWAWGLQVARVPVDETAGGFLAGVAAAGISVGYVLPFITWSLGLGVHWAVRRRSLPRSRLWRSFWNHWAVWWTVWWTVWLALWR